jgi:putative spermidine/putrescine transport system permease protein
MGRFTGFIGRAALFLVAVATLVYLFLPLLVIVGVSFTNTDFIQFPPQGFTLKWYAQFIRDPSYLDAFWLSAELAVAATALAVALGVPAALVFARRDFRGKQLLSAMFLSPLILPNIVVGIAILQYAAALGLARSFFALLVGHVVVIIPYVLRTTLAALSGFDRATEEAAQDLGASSAETFFLVTLPQIKSGVVAGGLFAFIISWINVEVTIFNATSSLLPLPVKILNYVQNIADPTVAAVSAITVYIAVIVVVLLDLTIGIEKATSTV